MMRQEEEKNCWSTLAEWATGDGVQSKDGSSTDMGEKVKHTRQRWVGKWSGGTCGSSYSLLLFSVKE